MEPSPFIHRHRVTYAECTVGDHIYYSRYLDLLEAARGEFFRALGFPLRALQDEDVIFPVIEVALRYKGMARYDDVLHIEVVPASVARVRLSFRCRILRSAESRLLLEAETHHACTSLAEKPRRIPEALSARLNEWCVAPPAFAPQA